MKRTFLAALVPALAAVMLFSGFSRRHRDARVKGSRGFDYYLLSMSWAPGFCAQPAGHHTDLECGRGREIGFTVHGLWPQRSDGPNPQNCASVPPAGQEIVNAMLPLMKDPGLIQHEWKTHGSCSGLPAADYFGKVRQAFTSIRVPDAYRAPHQAAHVSSRQIEAEFARANSAPATAFHVSCPGNEVREVRVCLTKELAPMQCPPALHDCASGDLLMRPVQ